ncbi:hypothetical protein KCU87_g150, partial [Aureobasidium melanogenum]
MRGFGNERSVTTGGGDTLLLSSRESASHACETEARAVDDVLETYYPLVAVLARVMGIVKTTEPDKPDSRTETLVPEGHTDVAAVFPPAIRFSVPGKSNGRATSDLLTSSGRCELDVGDGSSCQSGQGRQNIAAHCLCMGPTGEMFGLDGWPSLEMRRVSKRCGLSAKMSAVMRRGRTSGRADRGYETKVEDANTNVDMG